MNDSDNNNLPPDDQKIWDGHVSDMKSDEGKPEEDFEQLLAGYEEEKSEVVTAQKQEVQLTSPQKQKNITQPPQLDKRTEDKWRKGKIPIEARIDLHGLRQGEAYDALKNFIAQCVKNNFRCILVITGKGKSKQTSEDWLSPAQGVLKQNVPQWLEDRFFQNYVLKFASAQPKDGGSGALYVYLRRNR